MTLVERIQIFRDALTNTIDEKTKDAATDAEWAGLAAMTLLKMALMEAEFAGAFDEEGTENDNTRPTPIQPGRQATEYW